MNICVILIDALRADHLGCYGYPKKTSPHIDAIAQKSLLFENAISQCNWTYPSFYSLITGRYPSSLKISWWDQRVNENVPVLPTTLACNDYHSGLVTFFKAFLNPGCFCSHFDEAKELKIKDDLPKYLDGWLRSYDNSFLLLHMGEFIHEPFISERKYVEMFLDEGIDVEKMVANKVIDSLTSRRITAKKMRKVISMINTKLIRLDQEKIKYLLAAYDAGIYYIDNIVSSLYDSVRENSKDYLFIIIADHGQAFMEHGVFGHGLTLYEELVHVPLIVDLNGKYYGKIPDTVQLMDLFPTILEILGIEFNHIIDGNSLWPFFNGNTLPDRGCISEGYPYLCLRKGNHKLTTQYTKLDNYKEIFNPIAKSWKRKLLTKAIHYLPDKLFNLENDPEEKNNLLRKNKELYGSLMKEINEIAKRFTLENRSAIEIGIDDEIKKQLEALGYI